MTSPGRRQLRWDVARCVKLLLPKEDGRKLFNAILRSGTCLLFSTPVRAKVAATLRQLVVIVRTTGCQSWKSCQHIMARSCRWKNRPQHQDADIAMPVSARSLVARKQRDGPKISQPALTEPQAARRDGYAGRPRRRSARPAIARHTIFDPVVCALNKLSTSSCSRIPLSNR